MRADQVSQVRGYADQALRVPDDPMNSSNRRITLIVQYVSKAPEEEEKGGEKGKGKRKKEKGGGG